VEPVHGSHRIGKAAGVKAHDPQVGGTCNWAGSAPEAEIRSAAVVFVFDAARCVYGCDARQMQVLLKADRRKSVRMTGEGPPANKGGPRPRKSFFNTPSTWRCVPLWRSAEHVRRQPKEVLVSSTSSRELHRCTSAAWCGWRGVVLAE
jgi:hypothetical protein